MDSFVAPKQHVALRLSSGMYKLMAIMPNTTVSLGKFGSFYSNHIIGRPFHLTYEILSEPSSEDGYGLRVVPAAELHAEALISEGSGEADGVIEDTDIEQQQQQPQQQQQEQQQPMRTNRDIVDSSSTQSLTMDEIEELKKNTTSAGQDIIEKLLESHSSVNKMTAFALAKYKLRKQRKYLKRFTVLPLDVNLLTEYMLEKRESSRIMELRHEMIGLLGCWGNVHHSGNTGLQNLKPSGRYLVMDDTGGLVVAAMAERLGILYASRCEDFEENGQETGHDQEEQPNTSNTNETQANGEHPGTSNPPHRSKKHAMMAAEENTITVIHPNSQPNLSLLKHFGYDIDEPDESHPLYSHLKSASWLQVLEPESDNLYSEKPETIDDETLKTYKPRQRGNYHRKHARWARIKGVVDEVRAGGYDGLVVASLMEPESILKHAIPLLTGGASVAVYSPTIEPLTNLMDQYSTARRTAYINKKTALENERQTETETAGDDDDSEMMKVDLNLPSVEAELSSTFPLDPTLILAPMLQTSRVREWQVLPGRTHPLMSGRGGAEGYVFHGVRAIPTTERIQARGIANRKKRKLDAVDTDTSTPAAA